MKNVVRVIETGLDPASIIPVRAIKQKRFPMENFGNVEFLQDHWASNEHY